MNFEEARSYLFSLGNEVETMKLGLENITALLVALGEPHKRYKKVQVAGTNGKGSVCAFLDSICREAGIRTGLYTSPHLVSITERVKIDGVDIAEDEFARLATRVRETADSLLAEGRLTYRPTFFEQVTAIALLAFAEHNVELAILETGLGGRFDAVTAAYAEIAAITRIDLDHQEYLGDTIEEIAAEKAAIIRPNSIVCIGMQHPNAFDVVIQRCSDVEAKVKTLQLATFESTGQFYSYEIGQNQIGQYIDVSMEGFRGEEIPVFLLGEHQAENAALAVLVAVTLRQHFMISDSEIHEGLSKARNAGRLEWFQRKSQRILLDGAHNESGAKALAGYIERFYPGTNLAVVYGSMSDKDHISILKILSELSRDVVLTKPTNSRSVPPVLMMEEKELQHHRDRYSIVEDPEQALDSALQLADTYPATSPAFVLVTGSLYLVGEVRKVLTSGSSI